MTFNKQIKIHLICFFIPIHIFFTNDNHFQLRSRPEEVAPRGRSRHSREAPSDEAHVFGRGESACERNVRGTAH